MLINGNYIAALVLTSKTIFRKMGKDIDIARHKYTRSVLSSVYIQLPAREPRFTIQSFSIFRIEMISPRDNEHFVTPVNI